MMRATPSDLLLRRPTQEDTLAVLELQRATAGYWPSKYYFSMQVDLDELPQQPAWPAGCMLRTTEPGQDDQAVYQFISLAFDWPDRATPVSFER